LRLPLVAIVGRPNVGKSTFVNRIAISSETIVDETPGVTRDRNYLDADWRGKNFTLIDTGGLDLAQKFSISESMTRQALLAVEEADLIVFLVDAKTGLLPDDEDIAKVLRRSNKPVLLVVNKVDNPQWDGDKHQFYKLGLGEPLIISALHGLGTGDLLDEFFSNLPEVPAEVEEEALSIAIVGRPNVGKSSIFNKLLGEERVIVNELPGTTRDAIDTLVTIGDKKYRFIDTAGLRRHGKVKEDVEYYSFVRALRALDRADMALIVVDTSEGATEQDQRVAELAESRGCGLIIVLNKWDLVKDVEVQERVLFDLSYKMRFISYAPVLKISALTGRGMSQVSKCIDAVEQEYNKRISTPDLNRFLVELKEEGFAPVKKNKKLRLAYATQVKTAPPAFVFFVNNPELADSNYQRYLKGRLRSQFEFVGCPILIRIRKKPGK